MVAHISVLGLRKSREFKKEKVEKNAPFRTVVEEEQKLDSTNQDWVSTVSMDTCNVDDLKLNDENENENGNGNENEATPEEYIDRKVQVILSDDTRRDFERQYMCGKLLYSVGNFNESLTFLQNAYNSLQELKHEPLWETLFCRTGNALANVLDYLGNYDDAERTYSAVIEINPESSALGDFAVFLHRR